jgi:hypothetical protein
LKALEVGTLYVKDKALEDGSTTYTALKGLIELQGIRCLPTAGEYDLFQYEPGLKYDFDLDLARNQPNRGGNHIIRSFMAQFKIFLPNWRGPWLTLPPKERTDVYAVIALTPRWRDNSQVNWANVWKKLSGIKCYFVGFRTDYETFCASYCPDGTYPEYYPTATLLEAAILIRDCHTLYTNQNCMLPIAQGISKRYWLEVKPNRFNVLLGTANENILPNR